MRKEGYCLDITPYKRVKNIKYDGHTYIAFEQDWKTTEGYWNTTYLNLHIKEWDEFVRNLWIIDKKIPLGRAKRCFVCNDERQPSSPPKTKLSDSDYASVLVANSIGEEPARCEFCGDFKNTSCHCHEYNCRTCSSFNFCVGCGMCKNSG